jgi:1-acyl-sn-glycerol-3-phosphate acyltransferase
MEESISTSRIQQLMYRVMPRMAGELMTKYFRIEVEGLENIPLTGPALICPNHSGFSGLDAFLLGHHIHKAVQRTPQILTHKLWFATSATAHPMKRLGFVEATKKNGIRALKKNKLVVIFPEGEYGNFKPSNKAYHLQEFRRGFVRMALETQTPIIPALILGAEETHINLARLKLGQRGKGTIIPLPLNLIPLPAKWHIIFMKPIHLPYQATEVDNRELVKEICTEIRETMQARLSLEVSKRKNLYF